VEQHGGRVVAAFQHSGRGTWETEAVPADRDASQESRSRRAIGLGRHGIRIGSHGSTVRNRWAIGFGETTHVAPPRYG
jgi:hypothetical protein